MFIYRVLKLRELYEFIKKSLNPLVSIPNFGKGSVLVERMVSEKRERRKRPSRVKSTRLYQSIFIFLVKVYSFLIVFTINEHQIIVRILLTSIAEHGRTQLEKLL